VSSPFAPLSSAGAWIKPADHEGHLVIVANVRAPFGRKYDEMRKAEVDVATFDFVDLHAAPQEWQVGVQNSHAGFVNKLANILGKPGGMVLARVGRVVASNGHEAWVLAEHTPDDAAYAGQWVTANPAPAMPSPFTPAAAAAPAAPALPATPALPPTPAAPPVAVAAPLAAPVAAPVAAPAAPPALPAAPAPAAAPAPPAGDQAAQVQALMSQLAALQQG
jgi:hypothetical protein